MTGSYSSGRLTERDIETVVSVYKYRYLATSQIQRLHFPGSSQMAYRRLRVLAGNGYVEGFTTPGIDERVFHLGQKGADLVAEHLHLAPEQLPWTKLTRTPKDYYFLRHFLQLNDFRIVLTQACEASADIELLGFIPEYVGEQTEGKGVHKYIRDVVCDVQDLSQKLSHTPDGVFALQKEGKPALFFVEVDRGTEVLSQEDKGFLKAVRFYLNYLIDEQQPYQRYRQDFGCEMFKGFRVLFVTTSEKRLENMRQAVSALPFHRSQAKRFIWLSTLEQMTPERMFGEEWWSADGADERRYRIG